MKKFSIMILAMVFAAAVALVGCEKKAQPPKPADQPSMAPVAPAPAPAPAPVPAKPAKPAKK
jgi:2-oxoglutarate dehydrogenase E2 component (dihydrolipoamide succinyltransferase)